MSSESKPFRIPHGKYWNEFERKWKPDPERSPGPIGAISQPFVSDQIVYGIIDPDYARVFTQARIVAWQYGYACVMHGSFTRDLDLLLVPWTDKAVANGDQLMRLIAQGCGLRFRDGKEDINTANVDWSDKPHGRKACSLFFPEFGDRRWIDISIFEPITAQLKRA